MTASYKILGSDGREYGPIALDQLKAWVHEGRVARDTQVWRSDQPGWSPAANLAELTFGPSATAAAPSASPALLEAGAGLDRQVKSGASWFYWVAALSLVNSILAMTGSGGGFVIGLGVTQFIDGIAHEAGSGAGTTIALLLDVVAAGVFASFGFFAAKRQAWAFILGMVLYTLDGLLFVLVQAWLSVGFHVFALYCILSGFRACGRLRALESGAAV